MDEKDDPWDWHDHPGVTWAAGASAVALVLLLVMAVVQTSDSSHAPPFAPPAPRTDTTPGSAYTTPSSSTSYPRPSIQTSQFTDAPGSSGAIEAPGSAEPSTDESTSSTTIPNPYGTTTPTNAGHV